MEFLSEGAHGADLEDVSVALVEKFGGASGLADYTFDVFAGAPKGGQVQARILQQVLSIVEKHSALSNRFGNDGDYSDEELRELLGPLLEEQDASTDDPQAA